MKIEGSNAAAARKAERTHESQMVARAAPEGRVQAAPDHVQLSRLSAAVRGESPEHAAHVADVDKSVQTGKYNVAAAGLGDSLIDHAFAHIGAAA